MGYLIVGIPLLMMIWGIGQIFGWHWVCIAAYTMLTLWLYGTGHNIIASILVIGPWASILLLYMVVRSKHHMAHR